MSSVGLASEPDVQSEDEVARWADGLEILRHIARLARGEVRLRIDPAVPRPCLYVARAGREAEAACAAKARDAIVARAPKRRFMSIPSWFSCLRLQHVVVVDPLMRLDRIFSAMRFRSDNRRRQDDPGL